MHNFVSQDSVIKAIKHKYDFFINKGICQFIMTNETAEVLDFNELSLAQSQKSRRHYFS